MTAIEYDFDGIVTIRLCPELKSATGDKPAYWYLKRPMFTMDAPDIGWSRDEIRTLKASGFDVAYWNGERWATMTPKQFATAEEAFAEWSERTSQARSKVG